MALEAAGFAVGIVALLGVFEDCIDLLSRISAAKSMVQDYQVLNAKVDLEKALLLQWADRVGLGQKKYDSRLDTYTGTYVLQALKSIQDIFRDTAILRDRYGLHEANDSGLSKPDFLVSRIREANFYERFRALSISDRGSAHTLKLRKAVRWAIKDKAKFEKLVEDLGYFTNKLNSLVPAVAGSVNELILEDFAVFDRLPQSRLILDAASGQAHLERPAALVHKKNCEKRILEAIWFRGMNERRDLLDPPCPDTFEWALLPPQGPVKWSNLPEWLASPDTSRLYWIAGKPAAGKSTLMKHILDHKRTAELLREWAPCELAVASFFFRYLGSQAEKSLLGLHRTLLYRILEDSEHLIPKLLPNLWREAYDKSQDSLDPPTLAECQQAFSALNRTVTQQKFCFFIDGLDEYEGDFTVGVACVQALLQNENVKVIVSSRPIAVYHDAFHSHPMLKLEDLNRPDIQTYQHPVEATRLLQDLVTKSAGVFLWVVLACRTLLVGFADGDYIHELQDRTDELPKELEDLFTHVLARIEDRHRTQAVQLLQIAYVNQINQGDDARLMALPLALMSEHNLDATRLAILEKLRGADMLSKCQQLERRLRSRCQGLLEVVATRGDELTCVCGAPTGAHSQYHEARIDASVWFIHRTLFDYLGGPSEWIPAGWQTGKHQFDPHIAVACHAVYMAQLTGRKSRTSALFWAKLALKALTQAPWNVFEQVMTVLIRLGTMALSSTGGHGFFAKYARDIRMVHKSQKRAALNLIVELGLTQFVERHWAMCQSLARESHASPLLLHALCRPVLSDIPELQGHQTEMVSLLLSLGCDPNENVVDFSSGDIHLKDSTVWGAWLERIKSGHYRTDRKGAGQAICRILTRLVEAGADLSLAPNQLGMSLTVWVQGHLMESPSNDMYLSPGMDSYSQLVQQLLATISQRTAEERRQQ